MKKTYCDVLSLNYNYVMRHKSIDEKWWWSKMKKINCDVVVVDTQKSKIFGTQNQRFCCAGPGGSMVLKNQRFLACADESEIRGMPRQSREHQNQRF